MNMNKDKVKTFLKKNGNKIIDKGKSLDREVKGRVLFQDFEKK